MIKKTLFALLVIIPALLIVAAFNGLTPRYLVSAPGVASGIGSKLLCSARYVSGFSEEQAFDDLVQYSPILARLSVSFDDERQSVTSSLFGLRPATASHVTGVGCAIDYPGFDTRQSLQARNLPVLASHWPHGNRVETIGDDVQQQVEDIVARDNRQGLNTRALLVVHRGQIVAEAYDQGAGPDTPLLGWSMAKSLTAIMLGNLELRGLLNVDDTPDFEDWASDQRSGISIKNMLTMTDGLAFSEIYDPGSDATAMLFTHPSASAYAMISRLSHEPGSVFNYSSGTANLLSRIYFDRTGGTLQSAYDDYINNIVVPMSFQHSVLEVDASGVFKGSSYLYASARDWARMGQLMLNEGVLNGRRIISRDWVARSTTSYGVDYGYQWWLNSGGTRLRWPDVPVDAYAAQGNNEQLVMVIPSRDAVIVRLGWTAGRYPDNERFAEILAALE